MRRRQACYAEPIGGRKDWRNEYAEAGAAHLLLRYAGHREAIAKLTQKS